LDIAEVSWKMLLINIIGEKIDIVDIKDSIKLRFRKGISDIPWKIKFFCGRYV
jgi:hypothetical protein